MHALEFTTPPVRLPDGTPLLNQIHHTFSGSTGLVGTNGSGKSTLLSLIAAQPAPFQIGYLRQAALEQNRGTVAEALGVASAWAALGRASAGEATAAELASLEGQWDLEERIAATFARVGFVAGDVQTLHSLLGAPMGRFSGGEQVRVRLAALLLGEPHFLLLDEPTNHLDRDGRRLVHEFVAAWPHGLVVATHDRALLARVNTIVEIERGALNVYGGNYAFYHAAKARERDAASAALQSARETVRLVEREAHETAARQAKRQSRGRKNYVENGGMPRILAGLKKRNAQKTAARLAHVHDDRADKARQALAEAREKAPEEATVHVDLDTAGETRRRVVVARELQITLPDGRALWAAPVSFVVNVGDRYAVQGPNGAGKTSLLRALLGELAPSSGELVCTARRAAYLSQHTETLDLTITVFENVRREAPAAPEHELRIRLARLGFPGDDVFKPAGVLSGGERVRAALACLLTADQAPDLLLLDEPGNHLDLDAQAAVAAALRAYRGALLVVSHDPAFLADAGVTDALELAPGTPRKV